MDWDKATHYEVLQVMPAASMPVIKASYRALIQQYHPDRYRPVDEAERITKRLNEAYRVLSDVDLRAAYDGFLAGQSGTAHANGPAPAPKDPPQQDRAAPEKKALFDWSFWLWCVAFFVLAKLFGFLAVGLSMAAFHLLRHFGRGAQFAGATVAGVGAILLSAYLLPGLRSWGAAKPAVSAEPTPIAQQALVQPIQPAAPALPVSDGARLLELAHYNMTDEEFAKGSSAWMGEHKEYWNEKDVAAIQSHLDNVLTQYPMISLRAAFDMSLQRALKTGRDATAAAKVGTGRSTDHLPDAPAQAIWEQQPTHGKPTTQQAAEMATRNPVN